MSYILQETNKLPLLIGDLCSDTLSLIIEKGDSIALCEEKKTIARKFAKYFRQHQLLMDAPNVEDEVADPDTKDQ